MDTLTTRTLITWLVVSLALAHASGCDKPDDTEDSGGTADDAGDGDGDGDGDPCDVCLAVNCQTEYDTCFADEDCTCWAECIWSEVQMDCMGSCGVDAPPELNSLMGCAVNTCPDLCGA